ncbi:MAG: sulfatase [Myxococcota bacterium]|jgi:arylsulfatase A-like enzyme|nr:sulfatase [Myxococcota bacterium]
MLGHPMISRCQKNPLRSLVWITLGLLLACSQTDREFEVHHDLLEMSDANGATITKQALLAFGVAVVPDSRLVVRLRNQSRSVPIEVLARRDEVGSGALWPRRSKDGAWIYSLDPFAGELIRLELRVPRTSALSQIGLEALRIEAPAANEPKTAIERGPYNVLVILLDSLRADHLTPYGADARDTPHLAELASQGVVFTRARTNATWTRPSVVSMFSSRYPWQHGVLTPDALLPASLPYLPEMLGAAGYRAVGASGNDMVSALFGLDRGFESLASLRRSPRYRTSRDPAERAQIVWDALLAGPSTGDRPFFAYLHQLDPHSPYRPPTRFRRQYLGDRDDSLSQSAERLEDIRHLRMRSEALDPRQVDTFARLYKGEVAFMDAYVGELMQQLEIRGLAKNTLVVFTSDHGEEFYEHQSMGHGHSVYEELLRVPLILRLDGVLPAGLRIDTPVELLDLAPTLLDMLGQPIPEAMQGQSLLPLVASPDSTHPRPQLATSGEPAQHAIQWGKFKLVRRMPATVGENTEFRLFDLEADPRERRDISKNFPVTTSALVDLLDRDLRRAATTREAVPRATIDAETLEALKAIGYVDP